MKKVKYKLKRATEITYVAKAAKNIPLVKLLSLTTIARNVDPEKRFKAAPR